MGKTEIQLFYLQLLKTITSSNKRSFLTKIHIFKPVLNFYQIGGVDSRSFGVTTISKQKCKDNY